MTVAPRPVYEFGPFALHAASRLLMRHQELVPLTSKAFETLLALVQNAGRIMSKDELLRAVWSDAVVEEWNLTQTIFLLRKALGDTVRDHRYIVTVPKRGYGFVAEVRERIDEGRGASAEPRRDLPGPRRAESAAVYQLCLKGRHFWERRTAAGVQKAIRYFQQAIAKDPLSARAYTGLADCYAILSHCTRLSPRQTMPKARAAALEALRLDDTLGEAHSSLALVRMLYDWDWAGAESAFHTALDLNGAYATTHHWYGMYLVARGRFDEAVAELERAQELAPLSLAITTDLGLVLYLARRYEEAVSQYRTAIDLDAGFSEAQAGLLMACSEMGMYCEPISEFLRAPESLSRDAASRLEAAYEQSGARGYWQTYLDLAEAPSSEVHSSAYVRARIHAEVGDPDGALRWLEAACAEREGGLSLVKVDPGLDALRGLPAFTAIVERVGLAGLG